jgi:hypothetical protein
VHAVAASESGVVNATSDAVVKAADDSRGWFVEATA